MEAVDPNAIVYPDSDGEPMADNTLQFQWIVVLKENLDAVRPDFVAGDLLWYPVEGEPTIRRAPDVLVALGRPKGHRGSYRQWVEGQPPDVVMEVLSPKNTAMEMLRKLAFYRRHGAKEFYVVDPDEAQLEVWMDEGEGLVPLEPGDQITSPRLGITFVRNGDLSVYHADGTPFLTFGELMA
ncbi:MAG: Uma2 family endonuclease, partial [Myxococcota bacterium]